jgi:hypothetical protein
VSERFQGYTGNLNDQKATVLRELARLGIPVIAVYKKIEPGWRLELCPERASLAAAAQRARKHGAILVAESTSRFIRNIDWTTDNQDAVPTKEEFEQLTNLTGGVPLATILYPGASSGEERGYQSRRGQVAKGRKGGRSPKRKPGYKKQRRLALKPEALRLRRDGCGLGTIAKQLGVPKSTVQCWVESTV